MKNLFLTINFILYGLLALAQPGPIKTPVFQNIELKPEFKFETEVIDYGIIEQNSNGIREFRFTNIGNTPLIISEARKVCGCTVPSYPKEPIKPGESSVIKVKYATDRLGVINKSITILSNAKRSSIVLRIKGKVIAPSDVPLK